MANETCACNLFDRVMSCQVYASLRTWAILVEEPIQAQQISIQLTIKTHNFSQEIYCK